MSLARLIDDADRLPHQYIVAKLALKAHYPRVDLDPPNEILHAFGVEEDPSQLFQSHCDAQVKVISALQKAFETQHKKYPHVLQFVYGSIAKLEFLPDLSDIDILPVLDEAADTVVDKLKSQPSSVFRKYRAGLEQSLLEAGFKKKDIEICGLPLGDKQDFYRTLDLLGKVGKADEPTWAFSHRGSLIFECAYHPATEEASEQLRQTIGRTYHLGLDLENNQFPFSAALLLNFLRLSGVMAEVREARRKIQQAAEDEREGEDEITQAGRRKVTPMKGCEEVLKALFGRTWNSLIHAVMLHTLYWSARLEGSRIKRPQDLEVIFYNMSQAPTIKLIKIIPPTLLKLVSITFKRDGWPKRAGLSKRVGRTVEKLVNEIYAELGPPSRNVKRRSRVAAPGFPIAHRYIQALTLASHSRQKAIDLTKEAIEVISDLNDQLFDLLEKCEKVSLTLIGRSHEGPVSLIKLFGRETFDRQLIKQHFAAAAHARLRTPAAKTPGVRLRRATKRRRSANSKKPRGAGASSGMSIRPASR